MTDLVTTGALVASALSVGSVTFVKGLITEGAKDFYGQLRSRLVRLSEPAVQSLEAKPDSANRQGVIAEIVDERDDAEKRELASLARALIEALGEHGKTACRRTSLSSPRMADTPPGGIRSSTMELQPRLRARVTER